MPYKDPEKLREYNKKWYEENKEKATPNTIKSIEKKTKSR